ncbi:MAG: reverse transcriptase-like protein [Candidatus Bipolaricaulia bacterium]
MDKLFVYFAGDARGEPGPAGIGFAITDKDGNVVEEISRLVGRATPEVSEYQALIEASRHVLTHEPESVIFFTHSQRLANYVNGVFETRAPHINRLIEVAIGSLNRLPSWRVNYVDRAANFRAPRLVEQAFHRSVQAQVGRERLELVLLSRASKLSDEAMGRLIDYAERLLEEG